MPHGFHQVPSTQCAYDTIRVHAANSLNLCACDRLAVGDHRDGLHSSWREPCRAVNSEKALHGRRSLGYRHQLHAHAHANHRHAPGPCLLDQPLDRLLDIFH